MASTGLRAITTVWNGYRFRSRLEARWAIALHQFGIEFQYEPEGFELDGVRYLPDFYLPSGVESCACAPHTLSGDESREPGWWLEIKPANLSLADMAKAHTRTHALANGRGEHAAVVIGDPWPGAYRVRVCNSWTAGQVHCQEPSQAWGECPVCHCVDIAQNAGVIGESWESAGRCPMYQCMHCDVHDRDWPDPPDHVYWHKGMWIVQDPRWQSGQGPRLRAAFTAARQARFEHGERPRP